MGYGDEIIGTGLARGLRTQGKLAAFGDGRKIMWGPWCEEMFAHNPNIARPGAEQAKNLHWIDHYKGNRKYNKLVNGKWVWNYNFKVKPGEFFFNEIENGIIARNSLGSFIVIEPNVPWHKQVAQNKDWGESKYQLLADRLIDAGCRLVQFAHKYTKRRIRGAKIIETHKFREAIGTLSKAKLYIGPEGGMHHAAAAVDIRAVVIFGGFIPPQVIGYDSHTNLTGGVEACGNIAPCDHCRKAMQRISVDEVYEAARRQL